MLELRYTYKNFSITKKVYVAFLQTWTLLFLQNFKCTTEGWNDYNQRTPNFGENMHPFFYFNPDTWGVQFTFILPKIVQICNLASRNQKSYNKNQCSPSYPRQHM
ncbi:unnamed protein product [Ixodes pacificus]